MFQLIFLTVIFGSTPNKVYSQASPLCLALPLSSQQSEDKCVYPNCECHNICSNDLTAGITVNTIGCSVPEYYTSSTHEHCHLWGSDESHQQMLLIYVLRITGENLTLHYFNESYSSQTFPSRQHAQLCAASNDFESAQKWINESCMQTAPEIVSNMESACCNNLNINFTEGKMEVHFRHGFVEIPVDYLDCNIVTTAATPFTSNSIYNYSNTSSSMNPSSDVLVAGISISLLTALAVLVIATIIITIWIKKRKATKNVHNHDTELEEQDRRYATLTRQEYPDITKDHPTDALYAVIDMNKQGEEREMKHDEKNGPIPVEKKGQVALKDMYAVVNKQQKKKQNEGAPPALSNPVDGVYYNASAIRKPQAAEYEVVVPQIPPRMVALYSS